MSFFKKVIEGAAKVVNKGKDIFEQVEGISFDQWTAVNAEMASGKTIEEAIKNIGIDMPKWDRVNNEWLSRMENDLSFTLSVRYAKAFNKNASGNLPNTSRLNEESFPFEKYVEAMVAMDYLGKQEEMHRKS